MAKRRYPEPQEPVVKDFTEDEINRGIEKLNRRIADVQALDPKKIPYDDTLIDNVEHKIRETIREVFGPQSPEFKRHGHHQIWQGGMAFGMSNGEMQAKFAAGIPQTITMLEGLISWLEEKRADLSIDLTARTQTTFQGMDLHPRIASVCSDLFRDGHYANAVFDASKALINFVKERSGKHDLDGAPLMRTVFSRNDPILAFNDLSDQSDLDEQEGMMHLFEGAVLAIRNPRGHSFPYDSAERALEYIGLLSLLANRLEEARRLK
jgi:uncharacterized protein (TIGR02391 family)